MGEPEQKHATQTPQDDDQAARRSPHRGIAGLTLLLLILAVSASTLGPASAQSPFNGRIAADNFCIVCHSDKQVELQDSVHAREGIRCSDCHGGDSKAQTVAGAHTNNFRPSFDRKQLVQLCAGCHSDQARMKPYGIPTDQFALYSTSVHGQKWMQGDARVAVCSDCHGSHRVLAPEDPKSPVFRENITATCGKCHSNPDLMKDYNLSASIVEEYRQSVHGEALLERHNRQAPDCTRCHGTHGAAPPGIGDVSKVCGQCHTKTLESFRRGPHKTLMVAGKQTECASCHSNHRIEHASHQLWSTSCTACHQSDTPEADRGSKIQNLFLQADSEIDKARSTIDDAKRIPLDVSDYEVRLSDARTYLVEARPVSHNFSVEEVEDLTRRARSISLEIQSDVHQKMSVFRGRTIVLILVLFYILISIGVVVRYRRHLEAHRASRG